MAIPEHLTHYAVVKQAVACNDRNDFSQWLGETLLDYHIHPRNKPSDLSMLLTRDQSSIEGLNAIYSRALETAPQQLAFRQAIGDVILELGIKKETPPPLLEDLIYLTGMVCAVESVHAFPSLLASCPAGEVQKDLLFRIMANLKQLSPTPQVQETVTEITAAPYFDNRYLFEAINILAECNPERTFEYLASFQPQITRFRETVKILGGREWDAYCEVVERLTKDLEKYNPTIDLTAVKKMLLVN